MSQSLPRPPQCNPGPSRGDSPAALEQRSKTPFADQDGPSDAPAAVATAAAAAAATGGGSSPGGSIGSPIGPGSRAGALTLDGDDLSVQGTIDLWSEASLLRSETSLSGPEKESLFLKLQMCFSEMQKIIGVRPASVVTSHHALVCCCLFVVDHILCKNYTWLDVVTDRHIQSVPTTRRLGEVRGVCAWAHFVIPRAPPIQP